jgi:hypothetical protein
VFLTAISSREEEQAVRLLVGSIRSFGGAYSTAAIYVGVANPAVASGQSLVSNVTGLVTLDIPSAIRSFPFSTKVCASGQVEPLVEAEADWLVWIDPRAMLVSPPLAVDAPAGMCLSIRPVHYQNVGSAIRQPLDGFWRTIYQQAGVDTNRVWSVRSFMEGAELRAYYNCAFMAARPNRGLFRAWKQVFVTLLSDPVLRLRVSADAQHSTYLHQAVLSAVILAHLSHEEIQTLPVHYGYPLSVQSSIPRDRRANLLGELALALYEGSLRSCLAGITVDPEYQVWLVAHGVR